jgi:hypothetical protein
MLFDILNRETEKICTLHFAIPQPSFPSLSSVQSENPRNPQFQFVSVVPSRFQSQTIATTALFHLFQIIFKNSLLKPDGQNQIDRVSDPIWMRANAILSEPEPSRSEQRSEPDANQSEHIRARSEPVTSDQTARNPVNSVKNRSVSFVFLPVRSAKSVKSVKSVVLISGMPTLRAVTKIA